MHAKVIPSRPELPRSPKRQSMTKLHEPYWIIPERDGLEIYVAELGHIVLRQRDFAGEEQCVFVQPSDVMLLCDQLRAAAAEALHLESVLLRNHRRPSVNP
jgi:hypothetical protein